MGEADEWMQAIGEGLYVIAWILVELYRAAIEPWVRAFQQMSFQ